MTLVDTRIALGISTTASPTIDVNAGLQLTLNNNPGQYSTELD